MTKTERQRRWRQNKAEAKRKLNEAGLVEVPLIIKQSELDTLYGVSGFSGMPVGELLFRVTRNPIERFIQDCKEKSKAHRERPDVITVEELMGDQGLYAECEPTPEDEALVADLIENRESASPEDRKVLDRAARILELTKQLDKKVKGQ
jgi:hypothetical protein